MQGHLRDAATWKDARTEIYGILGESVWIILLGAAISVILYLPDQIRELYRIEIAERGTTGFALLAIPVVLIAELVWLGAKLVTTHRQMGAEAPLRSTDIVATALPAGLGTLPLVAFALGLYFALPVLGGTIGEGQAIVGPAFDKYNEQLARDFGTLQKFALISGGGAALFLVGSLLLSHVSTAWMAAANRRYFCTWRALAFSTAMIAAATAAFFFFPVPISRSIGVLGMLTVFTLCVIATTVHLTVLSREHRWPLIAVPLALAVGFSIFDLNDNHEVRRITTNAAAKERPKRAPFADDEFLSWYENRPDLAQTTGDYPVYIVAAQGGGIYAAYQAAIFLARMQDVCPSFKDHLFAISSVSGGSVGGAIFTAALQTIAASGASAPPKPVEPIVPPAIGAQTVENTSITKPSPCPAIKKFIESGAATDMQSLEAPGPHETAVRRMLANDLLSPLIGATLFTDFSQRFLFWPIGVFDRARTLEASFEAASSPTGTAGTGPLAQPFLDHWDPARNRGPALLLNATDAASGKRVVISPFVVQSAELQQRTTSLAHFPFWQQTEPETEIESPIDIPLSTAAGISARFPWLTPAATVTVVDAATKKHQSVRLVDGGYVDNSGVETALDLIRNLSSVVEKIALVPAAAQNARALRPVKLSLIALSGGDYPLRTSFSLGETLEPVRAMFSTRQSRAYFALERAREELPPAPLTSKDTGNNVVPISVSSFLASKLESRFYELPLGWALGNRTRDIIERQSGRFWECQFGASFEQTDNAAAQADCIQMLIYHELNQTLGEAAGRIAVSAKQAPPKPGLRLDNAAFLACARRGREFPRESWALLGLLAIWDQRPQWTDDRWLAFILGYVAHETGGFSIRKESLDYRTAGRIMEIWPQHFATIDEAAQYVGQPEKLANKVYGGRFGNREPDDGWRYRGRGLVQLTGRDEYRRYGRLIGVDLESVPDLILDPEIGAKVAFAQAFPLGSINRLAPFFREDPADYEGAIRLLRGGSFGIAEIVLRVKTFESCIKQTKRGQ
ncbi:MAG: hypothetical protein ABL894_10445 [Hyphomicrobium sp.]